MGPVAITEFSASGNLGANNTVMAITLTAAAAAATLTLKMGGSGGTVVLTLAAAVGTSTVFAPCVPFVVGNTGYVTLTGTGAVASVMYV